MRDCMRSMERATPDSTPRIKFDNDEVNNLLGPKRVPSGSTPKQVGGGTTIINKFFIFKLAQNSNLRLGMSDMFERTRGVFANRQWRFPCKRREVYCRTPNPHAMSRSRTRDFLAYCFTAGVSVFVSVSHMHDMCVWLNGFTAHNGVLCSQFFVFTLSAAYAVHFLRLFRHHWAFLRFSFALQSALQPGHQRDFCRFHLLTRFTIATIQLMCLSVLCPICTRLHVHHCDMVRAALGIMEWDPLVNALLLFPDVSGNVVTKAAVVCCVRTHRGDAWRATS